MTQIGNKGVLIVGEHTRKFVAYQDDYKFCSLAASTDLTEDEDLALLDYASGFIGGRVVNDLYPIGL